MDISELGLRGPPKFTDEERTVFGNLEVVRAAKLLYALDQRDMLASMFAELGESGRDVAGMAALAEVAGKHDDPRAMLLLGESAVRRGLPLDYYAYPVAGLPDYKPIAPPVGRAVAYSIARQESHFHQKVVSSAHAMGLMQVTPAAGKDTAKRFKVRYSRLRLLNDPVYNMQMGAAELSHLLQLLQWQLPADLRRLQCRPRPHPAVDGSLRRSARSQDRSGRLGGAPARFPRRAITCSASWRTWKSTARVLPATPSC